MERLRELSKKNGPLCVGLDTDPSYIPESVLHRFGGKAEAVFAYNREIINRIAADKSACCCKVQIAYYEAMGIAGMSAYAKTLSAVRAAGLSVISDIKRGDIANTAEAYARAHFSGDFETDIATVNPYMGFDTLLPFAEFCKKGKGIFVLLRTSNGESLKTAVRCSASSARNSSGLRKNAPSIIRPSAVRPSVPSSVVRKKATPVFCATRIPNSFF